MWRTGARSIGYLCVEAFVGALLSQEILEIQIPISAAMRAFVSAMPASEFFEVAAALESSWPNRHNHPRMGFYFTLLWDGMEKNGFDVLSQAGFRSEKGYMLFDGISVSDLSLSTLKWANANARGSDFSKISFNDVDFRGADLRETVFENCSFDGASMEGANLERSMFIDCDFSGVRFSDARFKYMDPSSTFIVGDYSGNSMTLTGRAAIGYLANKGAETDDINEYFKWIFHESYPIAAKIGERLLSHRNGQYLGLTQKGEARANPAFARKFVSTLESNGFATQDANKLVSLTPLGRQVFTDLLKNEKMHPVLVAFLRANN
jgi:uncharacterized protein YjbI with pentapeptide repeats